MTDPLSAHERERRMADELDRVITAVTDAYSVTEDQLLPPPEGTEVYAARRTLTYALERCGWSRAEIARRSGLSRSAITARMRGFRPTLQDKKLAEEARGRP